MSQIRYHLDEDAGQLGLIAALSLRGVDVTSSQQEGLAGMPDQTLLEWCMRERRVLYTFNVRHFSALHKQFAKNGIDHAGIVIALQQHYSIGEQMRRLLRIAANKSAEDMKNNLEFLSAWG